MPDEITANLNNEKILLRKAKRGDEESFEALILSCKGKAYNIALRYMQNEEDALDVLQESFIKIYRNLNKFNEDSRFDTWVYRIVVNAASDMMRKNKKYGYTGSIHDGEDEEDAVGKLADNDPGPDVLFEQKEEGAYILKCLDAVGAEHREILVLRDIRGFSYDEISEILECSIGTVKSRISRARGRLREIYLSGMKGREQIYGDCV